MSTDISGTVEQVLRTVASDRGIVLGELRDDMAVVDDLGFSSMMVATLIASLEEALGVDPFMEAEVMITDIRTVGDLRAVYERSVAAQR